MTEVRRPGAREVAPVLTPDAAFAAAANRAFQAFNNAPPVIAYHVRAHFTCRDLPEQWKDVFVSFHPGDDAPVVTPDFDALSTFAFHGNADKQGFDYRVFNVTPLFYGKPQSHGTAGAVRFFVSEYAVRFDPADASHATLLFEPKPAYLATNPTWILHKAVLDGPEGMPKHVELEAIPHLGTLFVDYTHTPYGSFVSHADWTEMRPFSIDQRPLGDRLVHITADYLDYTFPSGSAASPQ